jgi:hypothetical protein
MAVPLASCITGFDETVLSLELAVIDLAEIPPCSGRYSSIDALCRL